MVVEIVEPTPALAAELANDMREADAQECIAQGAASPLAAVLYSLDVSRDCVCVILDNEVAGMAGVVPVSILTRTGVLWLLTGKAVDKHKVTYVKIARSVLRYYASKWPNLSVGIDARYVGALRLAESMGFKIGGTYPHRDTGLPMVHHAMGA